MRKFLMLSLAGVALLVAACNTIEGAGKDISSAGQAVTHTARDARR